MTVIDKIFRNKKSSAVIYIILTVGILMLVCANSFGTEDAVTHKDVSVRNLSLTEETENILSCIEGVGKVSVMISYEQKEADSFTGENTSPVIKSVLVVADGGENSAVREKILRATKAALGAEAHKIEVFERKESNDDGS